jgi:hypothetical protein
MAKTIIEVELPFFSEEFKAIWAEWLEYRKERKLPKYVPRGLKMTFAKLVHESGGNESAAIDMIKNSMEQNYQGIYARRGTQYGVISASFKGSHSNGKQGVSEARINRAKNW